MHWKLKAHALATLSRVPGGPLAYRWFHDRKASRMVDADEMLLRALDLLATTAEAGGTVRGRDCLEIGTGWCPWIPLLLVLKGAGSVVTVDINPFLSIRTAVGTTRMLLARAARVAETLGLGQQEIAARLEPALHARSLDQWLSVLGISYVLGDATALPRPDASVDLVVSSNVLEHVPPDVLRGMHAEAARLLRPGGLAVHRFNPQDHFKGWDRSITGANFLQYSAREWHWLGGSGLSYHNRLRCCQHRALVVEAGLAIVVERTRPDPDARHAIETGRLRVHPDFQGLSPKDLTDDYMWIAATVAPGRGA